MTERKVTRDAGSGKFVSDKYAQKHPKTTVSQTTGQGDHPERNRDVRTGQFVTEEQAQKHPKTTISEGGR